MKRYFLPGLLILASFLFSADALAFTKARCTDPNAPDNADNFLCCLLHYSRTPELDQQLWINLKKESSCRAAGLTNSKNCEKGSNVHHIKRSLPDDCNSRHQIERTYEK